MFRIDRALLLRSAALLLGSGAAGLGANAIRPGGVALGAFQPPTTCTAEAGGAAEQALCPDGVPCRSPLVELAPREASFLCGHPGVIFADTRSAARFEEGHVADAIHLPCDATELGAQAAIAQLSRGSTVIVYGDSSDDGHAVAETLRLRGYRGDLRVLRGGFAAWEREGLACASGPTPIAGSMEQRP